MALHNLNNSTVKLCGNGTDLGILPFKIHTFPRDFNFLYLSCNPEFAIQE